MTSVASDDMFFKKCEPEALENERTVFWMSSLGYVDVNVGNHILGKEKCYFATDGFQCISNFVDSYPHKNA